MLNEPAVCVPSFCYRHLCWPIIFCVCTLCYSYGIEPSETEQKWHSLWTSSSTNRDRRQPSSDAKRRRNRRRRKWWTRLTQRRHASGRWGGVLASSPGHTQLFVVSREMWEATKSCVWNGTRLVVYIVAGISHTLAKLAICYCILHVSY